MQLEAMNLLKTILDRDKNLYSLYILPPLTSTFFLMKNNFFRLLEQNLSYEQKKNRMRLFGEKLFQQQKK